MSLNSKIFYKALYWSRRSKLKSSTVMNVCPYGREPAVDSPSCFVLVVQYHWNKASFKSHLQRDICWAGMRHGSLTHIWTQRVDKGLMKSRTGHREPNFKGALIQGSGQLEIYQSLDMLLRWIQHYYNTFNSGWGDKMVHGVVFGSFAGWYFSKNSHDVWYLD